MKWYNVEDFVMPELGLRMRTDESYVGSDYTGYEPWYYAVLSQRDGCILGYVGIDTYVHLCLSGKLNYLYCDIEDMLLQLKKEDDVFFIDYFVPFSESKRVVNNPSMTKCESDLCRPQLIYVTHYYCNSEGMEIKLIDNTLYLYNSYAEKRYNIEVFDTDGKPLWDSWHGKIWEFPDAVGSFAYMLMDDYTCHSSKWVWDGARRKWTEYSEPLNKSIQQYKGRS